MTFDEFRKLKTRALYSVRFLEENQKRKKRQVHTQIRSSNTVRSRSLKASDKYIQVRYHH
jgi:hypothetical protein